MVVHGERSLVRRRRSRRGHGEWIDATVWRRARNPDREPPPSFRAGPPKFSREGDQAGRRTRRPAAGVTAPGRHPPPGWRGSGWLDSGVRIATWNVNSVLARLPRLVEWLEQAGPDVACLQETKVADGAFPADAVAPLGYAVAHHGEGRWNGVAVLSRVGLDDVVRGLPADPGFPDQHTLEARTIAATCGPVRVRSVYVPNGRTPDDPHYAYKLRWLAALRDAVAADSAGSTPFALMGDYNVAPADDDVWDPAAFVGATHVTPAEREQLAGIEATGLTDIR